jgi:hypothetical protein
VRVKGRRSSEHILQDIVESVQSQFQQTLVEQESQQYKIAPRMEWSLVLIVNVLKLLIDDKYSNLKTTLYVDLVDEVGGFDDVGTLSFEMFEFEVHYMVRKFETAVLDVNDPCSSLILLMISPVNNDLKLFAIARNKVLSFELNSF